MSAVRSLGIALVLITIGYAISCVMGSIKQFVMSVSLAFVPTLVWRCGATTSHCLQQSSPDLIKVIATQRECWFGAAALAALGYVSVRDPASSEKYSTEVSRTRSEGSAGFQDGVLFAVSETLKTSRSRSSSTAEALTALPTVTPEKPKNQKARSGVSSVGFSGIQRGAGAPLYANPSQPSNPPIPNSL